MSAKKRAVEIYQQHIALAASDGRLFRKTVMDQLIAETGCSLAAAATHYNNSKKDIPVDGLGRPPVSKNTRRPGATQESDTDEDNVPESECFTVLELLKFADELSTGRSASFEMQGDASEVFDSKVTFWPKSTWVMSSGLGPNPGDTFKLKAGEKEIKRHTPVDA